MNIAITGATGHIGNCLVKTLLKQGHNINVLVRKPDPILDELAVNYIYGDILKPETLVALCYNSDLVFHLAAHISIDNKLADQIYKTNVIGTKNLLDASLKAKVKKFIHFSSISAFEARPVDQILDEERPLVEVNYDLYGHSKAESEKRVLEAVSKGLDAVILSPTGVFGPNDYKSSYLGQAIMQMYLNSYPLLVSGGFNWVDVRDVVLGAINAIKKGRKGHKYILSGRYLSLKEASQILGAVTKRKTPSWIVPISLVKLFCPLIEFYAKITGTRPLFTRQSLNILSQSARTISTDKAQNELGFKVRPFEDSLRDTIDWYKTNNKLK